MPYKEYKPQKLFYSIGEVAELLGESTSLVRFWSDVIERLRGIRESLLEISKSLD